MRESTRTLTYSAIAIALVAIATMSLQIPIPQTRGYINLGDTLIFVFALLWGTRVGALAGGLGSALADLLTGYAHWAPFTLIIKGIEGFLVGAFASREQNLPKRILFLSLAGLEMVGGYFLAGSLLYGPGVAIVEIPGNLVQAGSAVLLSSLVVYAIRRGEKSIFHSI
ncbi:MAG TPA: ECF transporter S component [Candidatus Atribacteria bacterium]|uniref:ECF transporter S component n=1 Tax=Candidatus Sordicultor fermentans TaxID=1953203 RepID=UPI0016944C92|nr:ECF transporter S component [Atribacterota bacterium]NLY05071.1 ECF transporter S component [Candidatus Atribacteria bacterium]MDI9608249.1 ECF transporter S component [Atribacterota bacterium]HOA99290.1 ECF transporter S component [Candidatus Atribacteria bacterium]HOQ51783.1 ECF transporter S component [Candidatus Atribacteria bacterium]